MITSPANVGLYDLPSARRRRRDARKRKPHGGAPTSLSLPSLSAPTSNATQSSHPVFLRRAMHIQPFNHLPEKRQQSRAANAQHPENVKGAAVTLSTLNWRASRRILLLRQSFEVRAIVGVCSRKEVISAMRFYTRKNLRGIFFFC